MRKSEPPEFVNKKILALLISLLFLSISGTIMSIVRQKKITSPEINNPDDDLNLMSLHAAEVTAVHTSVPTTALTASPTSAPTSALKKYNILIVTADDLSATAIPPYITPDHPMYPANLNSRFNKYLSTATTFHGIAPVPVCGPSRASFLTGRYPDRTNIYSFERYIPQIAPNISTVFQYFKDQLGYETFVAGKIFHTPGQDMNRQVEFYTGQLTKPRVATETGNSDCVGYMYCRKQNAQLADINIVRQMDIFLQSMANQPNKRFIAAAGFHRPHITNGIPSTFLNGLTAQIPNYTTPQIVGSDFFHSLAYKEDRESGQYKILIKPKAWQHMIHRRRTSAKDIFQPLYKYAVEQMIINYYAAIRFTLDNFGSILNQLDKYNFSNNTVVVFMSDHGWQNGERRIIGKDTLYPEATNVAFIWHVPGQTQAYFNKFPVSTTNLYPTLIDLIAGNNALKNFADGSGMPLDGVSMLPALNDNNYQVEDLVISQYPRCQPLGSTQYHDCMTGQSCQNARPPILFMGYTAVTKDYRYVEWRKFNEVRTVCDYPTWPSIASQLNRLGGQFWQIDPELTGTDWNSDPIQPELYSVENGRIVSDNLAFNPNPGDKLLMDQFSSKIKSKLQNVN